MQVGLNAVKPNLCTSQPPRWASLRSARPAAMYAVHTLSQAMATEEPGCRRSRPGGETSPRHPMPEPTCGEQDIRCEPGERDEAEFVMSRRRLFAMLAAFLRPYRFRTVHGGLTPYSGLREV